MNSNYLQCECSTPEHTLVFMVDTNDRTFYVYTQLNSNHNFFKRIWNAIKYIFGKKSKYGHWEETILDKNQVLRLNNLTSVVKNPPHSIREY